MKNSNLLQSLLIIIALLLSSCSPHSGTGVWKANAENEWGITRLVVGFEGRAEFKSTNKDNAVWHCFWSAARDKKSLDLECTPSTNVDQKQTFNVIVNDQGFAELRNETSLLATFTLQDENPSPAKK